MNGDLYIYQVTTKTATNELKITVMKFYEHIKGLKIFTQKMSEIQRIILQTH